MTDYLGDDTLGNALRSEVPERPDGYWASIDATLAAAAAPSATVPTESVATKSVAAATAAIESVTTESVSERADGATATAVANSTPVDAATDISTGRDSARQTSGERSGKSSSRAGMIDRLRSWPVLAAAALIIVAVALSVRFLPSNDETVDAGFATIGDSAISSAQPDGLPAPIQNLDHWNGVYGVWDCTANDGAGAWLPPFQSMEDDVGIHSHGDGLISIHPFFETSAGANATFSHFEDSMNIDVTAEAITLDDGRSLAAGTMCDGEPAVVQIRRWQSDFDLRTNPGLEPRVVLDDFGSERFYNDREVWIIALAPIDAELPLPPAERLDTLDGWLSGANPLDYRDDTETADRARSLPTADVYISAQPGMGDDPLADDLLALRLQQLGDDSVTAEYVPDTANHMATLDTGRRIFDVFRFESPGQFPQCYLIASALPSQPGGVSFCGPSLPEDPSVEVGLGEVNSVRLDGAPAEAAWMIVSTSEGKKIAAEVVGDLGYAEWNTNLGEPAVVTLLDDQLNELWSHDSSLVQFPDDE